MGGGKQKAILVTSFDENKVGAVAACLTTSSTAQHANILAVHAVELNSAARQNQRGCRTVHPQHACGGGMMVVASMKLAAKLCANIQSYSPPVQVSANWANLEVGERDIPEPKQGEVRHVTTARVCWDTCGISATTPSHTATYAYSLPIYKRLPLHL